MRGFFRCLAIVALAPMVFTSAAFAEGKVHHIAIQVDQNDPVLMNQALNNANNVIDYYRDKNEDVDVDIVAYGPGLHMLRADTSPVQDRIKHLKDMVFPGKIQFSACNITKKGMEKAENHIISVDTDPNSTPLNCSHKLDSDGLLRLHKHLCDAAGLKL